MPNEIKDSLLKALSAGIDPDKVFLGPSSIDPNEIDTAELNACIDELRAKATLRCPYSYPSSEIAECLTGDYLSKKIPY